MFPKKNVVLRTALFTAILAFCAIAFLPLSAKAQDVFAVTHFDTNNGDGTLRTVNPTTNSFGFVCEMLYVFDAHEELQECCGCRVTNNGLRVQSTISDLTSDPLTGPNTPLKAGVLKMVFARPNYTGNPWGACNPAVSYLLLPTLRAWETHTYSNGVTETQLTDAPLGTDELNALVKTCAFIHTNGSGSGICKCGVGDTNPPPTSSQQR